VNLKRVFLLIDSRHGIKPWTKAIMKALDAPPWSYQIVLTKTDKLKPSEAQKRLEETSQKIARRPPPSR
jgi:GTP-binding protein